MKIPCFFLIHFFFKANAASCFPGFKGHAEVEICILDGMRVKTAVCDKLWQVFIGWRIFLLGIFHPPMWGERFCRGFQKGQWLIRVSRLKKLSGSLVNFPGKHTDSTKQPSRGLQKMTSVGTSQKLRVAMNLLPGSPQFLDRTSGNQMSWGAFWKCYSEDMLIFCGSIILHSFSIHVF